MANKWQSQSLAQGRSSEGEKALLSAAGFIANAMPQLEEGMRNVQLPDLTPEEKHTRENILSAMGTLRSFDIAKTLLQDNTPYREGLQESVAALTPSSAAATTAEAPNRVANAYQEMVKGNKQLSNNLSALSGLLTDYEQHVQAPLEEARATDWTNRQAARAAASRVEEPHR